MRSTGDRPSQALVIGASRYQHLAPLRATQDAAGMQDVLASPEYCGYPPEHVLMLEEEAATREDILAALDAMCERARATGSRSFFYFSGHGGTGADGLSYLLPIDAQRGAYATTAISARELSERFARCAGELTVVLDCCRAAGVASQRDGGGTLAALPGVPAGAGADDDNDGDDGDDGDDDDDGAPDSGLGAFTDAFREEIQSRGCAVFAASRADGSAFVSPEAPYGIFTGHLLDGLRGAASTDGRDVTVDQLFDYVSQRVVLSSGKAQRPSLIASLEEFYPLTRYPRLIEPNPIFEKDVYVSYDPDDPMLEEWVAKVLRPELGGPGAGFSIWDHDELGSLKLEVEEAIVRSRYVIVLLTQAYLKRRFEELKTTMAIMQAVNTRTRRFIPIQREQFHMPLYIQAFSGIDMTPQREMRFRRNMDNLIHRLRKQPHER